MEGAINHMDSIGRPTSKVLAPPGGGSSNIFGTDPEPVKQTATRNRKNESSIFGAPEPVQTQKPAEPKVEAAKEAAPPKEAPKEAQKAEDAAPAQTNQKTTSIKVHAPPGGKSSIFFG
ncbi:Oidioi.mRNA.OKI2018_I69.chr2.g8351.t1.cds [Oikopleura dioica]|uniref:Microtubule-associated protein Jupiter n=1 Tax=Oikopleura dioica TaxID=34765 RepID=A0ABN7TEL5_OIKDI|nr:Oidioi.mRNA.OKI2018_I69.chr2.g8351.t1.cds [Oikopleura dioica]